MLPIFIAIMIAVSPAMGYEILDEGYPSPFTGVLLDESEVTDYMNAIHEHQAVTNLQWQVKEQEKEIKVCKSHYRQLMLFSAGGLVMGIGLSVGLIYILEPK